MGLGKVFRGPVSLVSSLVKVSLLICLNIIVLATYCVLWFGPWILGVFIAIKIAVELVSWHAAECQFISADVPYCAEKEAQSGRMEACHEYCVDIYVLQDHFPNWPSVLIAHEDTCAFPNRLDAEAFSAQTEDSGNFDCFLRPYAREDGLTSNSMVWLENGGITSSVERHWKRFQAALAVIGIVPFWMWVYCLMNVSKSIRCSPKTTSASVPQAGAPQQATTGQQTQRTVQNHISRPAYPSPVANRHTDSRRIAESSFTAFRLPRAQIDNLLRTMRSLGNSSDLHPACGVCLDERCEAGTAALQLPICKHYFHASCLTVWLNHGERTCPVCRRGVIAS